jgi:uncharacterized protein (DUF1786 family)
MDLQRMLIAEEGFKTSILSIDIGAFTQDILLWNGSFDTSFKLILPSPTQIMAAKVRRGTIEGKDLAITGETMGGGPFNKALVSHIGKGHRVFMTPIAARTVRDEPERVKEKGIEIVDELEISRLSERSDIEVIELKDIDATAIQNAVSPFSLEVDPQVVAVAVEDHGTPTWEPQPSILTPGSEGEGRQPHQTDREIRFEHFKSLIPTTAEGFSFSDPPDHYTRMAGVKRTLDRDYGEAEHLIMDSKIAAMFGAASSMEQEKVVTVDVGNGHTTVASIDQGQLTGIFETHTGMLTTSLVMEYIDAFRKGSLTNSRVFNDGGHGCYISEPIDGTDITVTGPKRGELFTEDPPRITFASPFGDNMITGNVGLVQCVLSKFDN